MASLLPWARKADPAQPLSLSSCHHDFRMGSLRQRDPTSDTVTCGSKKPKQEVLGFEKAKLTHTVSQLQMREVVTDPSQ